MPVHKHSLDGPRNKGRPVTDRTLVVSIDTEVDKSANWRISDPPSYRSIVEAVPRIFSPLFERYDANPTYLLSPEVIEDDEVAGVLADLGTSAELGTHLHTQFVEPRRELWPADMGGRAADHVQRQYPRDVEAAKLGALTELFTGRFGRPPTSFRSGRYGSSEHTLELLAGLGYVVDSSVTPGLVWRYAQGTVDYRGWSTGPRVVETAAGSIVELPLSIRAGGRLAPVLQELPPLARRAAGKVLGPRAGFSWLRPSWAKPGELAGYVAASSENVLVAMLHSMEVVPGASPYAIDDGTADRIVRSLEELLRHCADHHIQVVGMTAAARRVQDS